MAIIKLNNNALTSVTELPSGLGGDPDVKVDIARLGLRVFANQNLAKQNSNSASYDVFQMLQELLTLLTLKEMQVSMFHQ